ncbi:MAG: GldG family protein [Vicinamibacterales bacterium]
MLKRIVGFLGTAGSVLVFAAVAVRFLRPAWQDYAYWMALGGLVAILLYAIAQWREIARVFMRRQARYGTLALVSTLIVLGILVAINYIASRQNRRWDLTAGGQYTLSDQTAKVLGSLDAPLQVTVFAKETDFLRYQDRLNEYGYLSRHLNIEYVDPDKNPARAQQAEIQSYGTIVLQYKGRTERVVSDTEQEITNGIIKVVTGAQKKVYFVQGHGEKDPTGSDRTGYNTVATALGRDNFGVEKLVLAQETEVPADATLVVIAGPAVDLLEPEIEKLRRFLGKGGKALFLVDPPSAVDTAPLTRLNALIGEWGIELGNDVVVDASGLGQLFGADASVPVVAPPYPTHPITDNFGLLTAYPFARSVKPATGGAAGREARSFAETGRRSWAETDIAALLKGGKAEVTLDEDKGDKPGPISIAAAVTAPVDQSEAPATPPDGEKKEEGPKPETRVAVIGDSDFAANYAVGIQGNRDFFMNVINWLAQQENLISIRPKDPQDRRITMTADQQSRLTWLSLVIIPVLIIGTGVLTWWRRR